ncbi:aspartate/glutamate racemase family protein [Roseivivax sediminis]|uniref:Asp/Glu/hydantoin racemase n=1 Tax=Roseivivax sediminis TaxID=936889 RepID=A0A1I1Z8I1_9RHOB|nr:aspartate/glutamate racemase family protein [Roseivivax sediminis]SFE28061.1 Asp/Glu/hydantoin racemase [Roseivivax sediminis]
MRIWYQSYVDSENGGVYWTELEKHLNAVAREGTEIVVHGITPYDSYAHPLVEWRCAREMICNAVQAEREGYDAFVVGHFQDAGLYEARAAVDIPVIALGEASMLHACTLGQRIGIITINRRFIPWFHHQISKYGLRERVSDVYAMDFEPGQILGAFGSDARRDEVARLFAEQAMPMIGRGTDVLIPGGGIPMLLFSQVHAHRIEGLPVLNGIPVAVKAAESAVELKREFGLSVSRTGDFLQPPREVIDEFLEHPARHPARDM